MLIIGLVSLHKIIALILYYLSQCFFSVVMFFYSTKNKSRKTLRKVDLKGKCVFPHNFSQFFNKKKEIKEHFTPHARYALLFFRFIQTIHDV